MLVERIRDPGESAKAIAYDLLSVKLFKVSGADGISAAEWTGRLLTGPLSPAGSGEPERDVLAHPEKEDWDS
jgi:hypothetical protein